MSRLQDTQSPVDNICEATRRRDEFIVWTRGDQWFIGTTTCALWLVLIVSSNWPGRPRCILDGDVQGSLPPPRYTVDLQTATWPALAQIPGIGETLARRIIAARREQELAPERLTEIKGIGEKKLQLALPYLQ